MNSEQTSNAPSWGFMSPDGYFQTISKLNTILLEYVCKTTDELHSLIEKYIITEEYEKCAVIRDEILRRAQY
ncbi:hypothetical protein [Mucilaginibacter sp. KACC 22063]|uniref:hypothetical protein n=1 Tax=Mucilaginibacter sp. KACC 22063 TaxID=3025666 RepID=UPI002366E061|nr:hypothetical protein [Mucilaginibacter sp. KACC 22063]WDF56256.1 hypothetical protein PQ461_04175 [Mucilaginibacter sp. KACC 22063]